MDKKIRVLAAVSAIAILTSGCSSLKGPNQGAYGSDSYGSGVGGSSQMSRTGQVSSGDQVGSSSNTGTRNRFFGQQSRGPATCAPCATATPKPKPQTQNTYTYRPAPKPKVVQQPQRQAGQHNQQYYIDRWNRQQQQNSKPAPAPAATTSTYSGYGSGSYDAASKSNSTYYDYSSSGGTAKTTTAPASVATSNKSIYTGSYQQKTYKPYNPTTYAGGSAATTNTSTTTVASAPTSGGGSTYTVKKGDTVFEIMRQTGVYWKDIIRVNNLQPPYNIAPGQTIRLK